MVIYLVNKILFGKCKVLQRETWMYSWWWIYWVVVFVVCQQLHHQVTHKLSQQTTQTQTHSQSFDIVMQPHVVAIMCRNTPSVVGKHHSTLSLTLTILSAVSVMYSIHWNPGRGEEELEMTRSCSSTVAKRRAFKSWQPPFVFIMHFHFMCQWFHIHCKIWEKELLKCCPSCSLFYSAALLGHLLCKPPWFLGLKWALFDSLFRLWKDEFLSYVSNLPVVIKDD